MLKTFSKKTIIFFPLVYLPDLIGYIVSFATFKSSAGNEGFDVKFQISPTNNVTVKIMKAANPYITDSYINNFKQAANPISLQNLNRGSNGIYFFNSSRGSRFETTNNVDFTYNPNKVSTIEQIKQGVIGEVNFIARIKWLFEKQDVGNKFLRESVVYDSTDNIRITIWEDLLDCIDEQQCYHFHNILVKDYYGIKLTTTKSTRVEVVQDSSVFKNFEIDDQILEKYRKDQESLHRKLNPIICCPKIQNLKLEVTPGCTNVECQKPVTILPSKRSVTCIHCNTMMRKDQCKCIFNCALGFDDVTLKLPLNVLAEFLGEDVLESCQNDLDAFKDDLLFLENIDYFYNMKNVITAMAKHNAK